MPLYKYKALSYKGENLSGTYEAKNEDEVVTILRQSKSYPINISKTIEKKNILDVYIFPEKVSRKDLAIFCRQFYTMLNAGIPIVNCLDVLIIQTENKRLKYTLSNVYKDIQKGVTFSTSLRNQKKIFPELFINMIEAGELSGNLDSILERMAINYEKEDKITNKVKNAMTYPIMLSIVSIFIVIFLLVFVMPIFLNMFERSILPLPTKILLTVSYSLANYWHFYIIGFILFVFGFIQLYQSEKGRLFFDKLKLKVPVVKRPTEKLITSQFTRTLATLLSSGIPLIQALESTSKVTGNKAVEYGMKQVIDEVSKGSTLANSLKKLNIFPLMVISMVEIGEESGQLSELLDKTANFYDYEVEGNLEKMTALVEPFMILVMSILIGGIVIAMILPMFDMLNTISF